MQRGFEALHELILRERAARDIAIREVDTRVAEERRMREQEEVLLRKEIQENEQRLQRDVAATQAATDAAAASWRSEVLQLHQHVSALLAQEESQRKTGHEELLSSLSQDKSLRKQNGGEFAGQVELLQRSLEQEAKERRVLDTSLSRLAQELRRRCEEEAAARREDLDGLRRRVAEEGDKRLDGAQKLTSLKESIQELESRVRSLQFPAEAGGTSIRRDLHDAARDSLAERVASLAALVDAEREARTTIKAEAAEHCVQLVSRLREDCKEAVQKEVRSRLERERNLREELSELRASLDARSSHIGPGGAIGSSSPLATVTTIAPRQRALSSAADIVVPVEVDQLGQMAPGQFKPELRARARLHSDPLHSAFPHLGGAVGSPLGLGVPGFGAVLAGGGGGGDESTTRSASTAQGEVFLSHRVSGLAGPIKGLPGFHGSSSGQ